jgi:hypothetical protein
MNDFNMQSTKRRASLVLERRTSLSFISENAYDEPTVAVMQEDEIACYAPTSSLVDMNMKEYSSNLPPMPQASRRMSLGISMEDIYDLTGESDLYTSQELDTIIHHDQQHPLGLEIQKNESLPKQSVVFRRTSLSFMPINSSDPFNFNFDMEGDDLNLLDTSDLQGIWESEDMVASSSSQIVDPYNPLQDPEFAQRYEIQLEGLIKCMKKSSSTRSKVALIKKDIKKKFSYATKKQQQKLAAMGLNKSQDTRKRLLEMGLATSSGLNKVSYADIKSSRRRRRSPCAASLVPSSKAFSHLFDPTEFEKQSIRSVSMDVSCFGGCNPYNTMNKGGFMPEKVMNRNKFARRRSSLTLQTYQMQFFPDF